MRCNWALALSLLAALGGCMHPAASPRQALAPPRCRVGPDGGPVLAVRGIGGTGAPLQTADRGIGGTGIIGVITGFGSICLAGQEVALPSDVPVTVDDRPASPATLRAGQLAAVEAQADVSGLHATRVIVLDAASGPVDLADGDRLRVAGQDVAITAATWGLRPHPGDWVSVSGLRRPDGTIEATRIDARAPGPVLVRGTLREMGGVVRIGALPIRLVPGLAAAVGTEVTIEGDLVAGTLIPGGITPDLLASDPAAFFGPAIGVVLLEGFALPENGRLRLGRLLVPAPGVQPGGARRGVFRLERGADGIRASERAVFPAAPARLEPAPVPNRASGGGIGFGRDAEGPGRVTRERVDRGGSPPSFGPRDGPDQSGFGSGGGGRGR